VAGHVLLRVLIALILPRTVAARCKCTLLTTDHDTTGW